MINSKGGHSFVWFTRTAMHPDYQQYILDGIEYYVNDIGITGIFRDSGYQPMPPDFANRQFHECPGESMTCAPHLYDKAYRFGRRLSDDFFMWAEGIGTEFKSNGFAVYNVTHGLHSGHKLMHRIAHAGPRRLVWRSAWPHDVAGAFPFISPICDIGQPCSPDTYKHISANPMNQWLCKTVKERGCRQAVGIADGISVLDEFVVAALKCQGKIIVPQHLCRGHVLENGISGSRIEGTPTPDGVAFDLPESGAWRML